MAATPAKAVPVVKAIQVPLGLDEAGAEVPAASAVRGTRYHCPDCHSELTAKLKGERRVKHFAHRVEPTICDFRHETVEHYRAKMAIAKAVNEGVEVQFLRPCPWCGHQRPYPMPPGVVRATVEHVLTTRHRADVALLDAVGDVITVVEVLMHHEVDAEKAAALADRGIPWVEIAALDILEATEPIWPLRRDHLPVPGVCGTCCSTRAQAIEAMANAVAKRLPVTLHRPCPGCQRAWSRPIPEKVAHVIFDHELTDMVQVAALLDAQRTPVALFDIAVAERVGSAQLEALRSSGLPWAVFAAEALLRQSEPLEWHLAIDGFNGTACRSCRRRQRQRKEEERHRREREQLIDTYRATHPLLGPLKLEVACPLPGVNAVSTIGACAVCPYFLDAQPDGIVCYGSSEQ